MDSKYFLKIYIYDALFSEDLEEFVEMSVKEEKFDSWGDLCYFVRGKDYVDGCGNRKNSVLDGTICTDNPPRRPKKWKTKYFLTSDEGKVIDLRKYEKEIYSFDVAKYVQQRYMENKKFWDEKYKMRDEKWEKDRLLTEGKYFWDYYRRMKTTNEKRANSDPEIREFIRGRRSVMSLPSHYDDKYFCREKTWKAREKVRAKWMVNLKKHVDTYCETQTKDEQEDAGDCYADF